MPDQVVGTEVYENFCLDSYDSQGILKTSNSYYNIVNIINYTS